MRRKFCDLCGQECQPLGQHGNIDSHRLDLEYSEPDNVSEGWDLGVTDCCAACAKRIHDRLVSEIQIIEVEAQRAVL